MARNRNRAGQTTVIIIVSLLILVVFWALFYQSGLIVLQSGKKQLEVQTMTQAKLVPVRDYVQSCLDLSLKDGMITLGEQAGYLFKGAVPSTPVQGQGGSSTDFLPGELDGSIGRYILDPDDSKKIIPYAIFKREQTSGPNGQSSDAPTYPYPTFPVWRLENDTDQPDVSPEPPYEGRYRFGGIYGANLLPPLEKPSVQPLPDFLNPDHSRPAIESMQQQLEVFTLNHTRSCVDFSRLSSTNLLFTTGTAYINISFTNQTTVASLHLPINMTDKATGMQLQLSKWVSILPVRMEYFHLVLDYAVSKESDTLRFISSNVTTPDRTVIPSVRKGVVPGSKDYIIAYTDNSSTIDGKPYGFRFAVHNRPPALYYVNRTVLKPDEITDANGNTIFDPVLQPGPILPLKAADVASFTLCATRLPSGTPLPARITLRRRPEGDVIELENPDTDNPICTKDKLIIPLFALDPDEDVPGFSIEWNFGQGPVIEIIPEQAAALEDGNTPVELTVKVSDGKMSDSQTVLFNVHYEPPSTP